MFSHQQSSNVRNEDAVVNHAFSDGSRLFAVFDGTSWRGVFPEGGFEVAQEVASVLPRLVWAELARVPASQSQEKRARPSEGVQDTRVLRALHQAVAALDEHLFSFEAHGRRVGLEAGGSLVLVYLTSDRVAYSLSVGDCEGAAFNVADGVEQKMSFWPHNCNFVKEMQHIKSAWGLHSLDAFFYDEHRKLFFSARLANDAFSGSLELQVAVSLSEQRDGTAL